MTPRSPLPPHRARPWALAFVLILGGASAAPAQDPAAPAGGGAFDGVLRALDLKAKPTPAPDFVRNSRPATSDYIPVGRTPPGRPLKVMSPAEVEAATQALDKDRVAQQRRAGVKPPPVPLKTPKDAKTGKSSLR